MKYKPKNKITTIIIVFIGVIAAVIASRFGFASTRTATRVGYAGHNGWRSWSGSYILLDGTMQKSIHPKDDILHVEVKTESGRISIEINDADGNVIFDEIDIGTASFNVDVFGKVTVKIVADSHKGSFAVTSEN